MITEHRNFLVSSDILNLPNSTANNDTFEDAQEAEKIVMVAEEIFNNMDLVGFDGDMSRQCIELAEHLINKYKIDITI